MASDMFLKLDGIPGESKDSSHTDEIDIMHWQWGMANAADPHIGGGGGRGKVAIGHITLRHRVDKSSPVLKDHCCTLKHIPTAELVCRKAGGEALEYLKITMEQVMVAGVDVSATAEGDLVEDVALAFAKVTEEYTPQSAEGTGEGAVTFERNIEENV